MIHFIIQSLIHSFIHSFVLSSIIHLTIQSLIHSFIHWFRLQNEVDACVKYDNTKKIWIYLHRDKGLEDFDAVSTGTKPRHRARKKIKLEDLQAAEVEEDTVLGSPGPGGPAHFAAGRYIFCQNFLSFLMIGKNLIFY